MELFKTHINQINAFLEKKQKECSVTERVLDHQSQWPRAENKQLVLGQDTAVELGHPQTASTSALLWTNDDAMIQNRRISILGPELSQIKDTRSAFGKIVLVQVQGFTEENTYLRYRQMEQIRYNLYLKGYMMRGASQFQREWSRVSRDAMSQGFSLETLGRSLMDQYLELDFVRSVQIIFITSNNEDVFKVSEISKSAMKIIGAMNKMAKEMSLDCDSCEYVEVCSEVASLRNMRRRREQEGTAHA